MQSIRETRRARDPRWLVLGTFIALTASIAPVMFFTFGHFLRPMERELGWSRSVLSGGLLLITVVTIVSAPVTGRLVDRLGMTRVVAPAIVLLAIAIASLAWVGNVYAFYAAFLVMGLVGAAHSPLSYSGEIARRFTTHRGKALGFATAGIGIGGALMPFAAQHTIAAAGWRPAYLVLAALVLLVGGAGFLVFRLGMGAAAPRAGHLPQHAARPGIGWRALAGDHHFRLLLPGFFLIGCGINGTISHLGAILGERGIDGTASAAMQGAMGAAMIVGRIGCGFLLDKFHPRSVAILFVVAPLAGLLLLLTPAVPGVMLFAAILIGLGLGAEADLLSYFTARYFPAASFSEISGYFFSAFTLGVGTGTLALARSFDLSGSYFTGLVASCLILAVLCVLFQRIRRVPDALPA